MEAFQLALRLGATGLESDVWTTADGVAVLDHDGVVRTRLRKQPIGQLARVELPDHIPTLAELLTICGSAYHLSLDLKSPSAGPAVIAVVKDVAPDLLPRLWLCHPDRELLTPLAALDPSVRLVMSTRLARLKEGPERCAATMAEQGIHAINLHHSDWTGGLTTLFHRFGRIGFAWDLQHDHMLRELLRMGIDGVFSDWVDRMIDAVRLEQA